MSSHLTSDNISDLVRRTRHHHVVATVANCNDPCTVVRWITGEANPSQEQQARLAFLHQWSVKIPHDPTFRLWLEAPVVRLAYHPHPVTPVVAIQIGAFKEVNERARFIYHAISETFGE